MNLYYSQSLNLISYLEEKKIYEEKENKFNEIQ